jgi:hypothetical protein
MTGWKRKTSCRNPENRTHNGSSIRERGTANFFILRAEVDQSFERTVSITANGVATFSSSLLDNALSVCDKRAIRPGGSILGDRVMFYFDTAAVVSFLAKAKGQATASNRMASHP